MKNIFTSVLLLTALGFASGIHVSGNRLIDDKTGHTVVLQGFSHSGTEFACLGGQTIFDGPSDDESIRVMKQNWHINAVRVPMNEHCWLGINGAPSATSGQKYREALRAYVKRLLNHGIYVMLDLHWTLNGSSELAKGQQPMPNSDHSITFWEQCAAYFKDEPNVIFDVFNEPYPERFSFSDGWRCFRDGGSCSGIGYQVAGMQTLVDAVRRVGAKNVIMLGGLSYSNDLSQWLQYVPHDSLQQLAASAHLYNFNWCNNLNCWQTQLQPIAQTYPLIIAEYGQNDCAGWYVQEITDWMMKGYNGVPHHHLAWTYNTWDCKNGPALITDYTSGTCTQNYGCTVQQLFKKAAALLATE